MDWYLEALRKYSDFSGRARRKEYWMFFLLNPLVFFALFVIDGVVVGSGLLGVLYGLATLLPSFAVLVRRLHDTGRSGWWMLIAFVPVIGLLLPLFLLQDSTPGPNEYGESPKGSNQLTMRRDGQASAGQ